MSVPTSVVTLVSPTLPDFSSYLYSDPCISYPTDPMSVPTTAVTLVSPPTRPDVSSYLCSDPCISYPARCQFLPL
ncbi:hypothetical protein DPMN_039419 [Dreissena polymorpha]|uniref:Uncharacterized protein n=1 Tax=Dreissena polymorpha TaxID=45954 RepID=A0A9D4RRN6_DREPO|nr:hypothetical protein DPMN_039419 [Dreissena polymorpha]